MAYYTGERDEHEVQSQRNLAKFMKILTVKRLESSFTASMVLTTSLISGAFGTTTTFVKLDLLAHPVSGAGNIICHGTLPP
jgi:hypothetical protein